MCGRYNLISDAQALVDFFSLDNSMEVKPCYNIAPSQNVPAVRQGREGRVISSLCWGLIPYWAKHRKSGYRMINARAETVADKPSFRMPFRQQRCLIPATGFYEWLTVSGGKQPYNIRIGDGELFAFAGLWERWRSGDDEIAKSCEIVKSCEIIESCTIIVTEANDLIRPIHDRMPVILDPADYATWLDPELHDPRLLQPLLGSYLPQGMNLYPVSRRVGSPVNDDPELVTPLQGTN